MGLFRRAPELLREPREDLGGFGAPRSTRRWAILWRTVQRFAGMALVATVLIIGRRALEGLGLSSKPATIGTVALAAAVLVFGGPRLRRRGGALALAPSPPPIDPELIRQYVKHPDPPMPKDLRDAILPEEWIGHLQAPDHQPAVRPIRSASWWVSTGSDGHIHSDYHERGSDGQTRNRTYEGCARGAVWKLLRRIVAHQIRG